MYQLKDILAFMKKHPIKAYEYSGRQSRFVWDEVSGLECLWSYIKDWYYYWKYRFEELLVLKRQITVSKRLAKKLTEFDVMIKDRGDCWSPRLDIDVRRKTDADFDLYVKQLDYLDKFYDKWCCKISIYQWDEDLVSEEPTDKLLKSDADLRKRFEEKIKYFREDAKADGDDEIKILFDNVVLEEK